MYISVLKQKCDASNASRSATLLQEKSAYPIILLFHIIPFQSSPVQSSPYSIPVIKDTRVIKILLGQKPVKPHLLSQDIFVIHTSASALPWPQVITKISWGLTVTYTHSYSNKNCMHLIIRWLLVCGVGQTPLYSG